MTTQKRILVVDDEPDLTLAIRKRLEKEGFLTDVAYDGSEAMAKVEANPGSKRGWCVKTLTFARISIARIFRTIETAAARLFA